MSKKEKKEAETALVPTDKGHKKLKIPESLSRLFGTQTLPAGTDPVEHVIAQLDDAAHLKSRMERVQKKQTDLQTRVALREAVPRRVSVDVAGGSIAQVSTELLNWGMRALGRWSGSGGFWGRNVDLAQGVPHFVIGLALYTIEMLDRRSLGPDELPTAGREVLNEAAKLFGQLGMSNTMRALRVRYLDGKSEREQSQLDRRALMAEREQLKAQLAERQKTQR